MANYKLTRRTVVLAALESSYADPATAITAANGLLCNMAPEISAEGERIERDPVRDTLSPIGHVIGAKQVPINLTVEAKGGGVVASAVAAPEYEQFLLSCGLVREDLARLTLDGSSAGFLVGEIVKKDLAEVEGRILQIIPEVSGTGDDARPAELIVLQLSGQFADTDTFKGLTSDTSGILDGNPGTAIGYRPESSPALHKSTLVYFFRDGILHKCPGWRGTLSLNIQSGQIPSINFQGRGLWSDPADETMPTPAMLDLVPPTARALGARIAGHTPVFQGLSLELRNEITPRRDLNAPEGIIGFNITNRNPGGSIDPEVSALAGFNPWEAWKTATPGLLHATIGHEMGNRIGLYVPKALYDSVSYGDRDGTVTYDLPFTARADDLGLGGGDDEFWMIYS
ncbi:hypothetical protein SAMN05660653_00186 [Desulfonatronum thiosulfatophilum]|uniref:Uncharacterized protein n=1 Tax=Desulfonatronum thiosulfatophilum TaxID=617002 RepID=A0A1G6A6R3_9BACT|nr:phage tail tube protein [Desulfonatronum thiosulfatophilum]SDB04006.1 hypothetical protein SAMN05660653_00186 [Desulfonatronum thiosulfatophilum]